MKPKIAVLGAGAIGSSVATDFSLAGLDIAVVDQWPAQVEAMKSNGLRIDIKDQRLESPINAYHLCELASLNAEFEMVFMAVKSNDARWMAELIRPYLKEDGVLVGLQNSLNDDAIASIIGRERTVGSVVELSAEIFEPGIVQRDTTHAGTWFGLGELSGEITPRLGEIEKMMRLVGQVGITQNIYGAKWTKLIANSMTMGPFGLLGLKNWEAKELPGMIDISIALGRESLAVGRALDYQIEPIFGLTADEFSGASDDVLRTAMDTLMKHVGSSSSTAPVHDHKKGRKTEMEFINGLVVRKGKEVGVPTPFNSAVCDIDRQICRGEIGMTAANFDLLNSKIAAFLN